MSKLVIFGDSFSDETMSYVTALRVAHTISNFAVSGTTLGEYSIYPVDGESLVSKMYQHAQDIAQADAVLLEYGANDASAVAARACTRQQVLVSLAKAADFIRKINPRAKLFFLSLTDSDEMLISYAEAQVSYLSGEWLPDTLDAKQAMQEWILCYGALLRMAKAKGFIEVPMMPSLFNSRMQPDGLHPTRHGYSVIATRVNAVIQDNMK